MTIRIGFTGTRNGMTKVQAQKVRTFIDKLEGEVVGHHGDCIGSDEDFHKIVREAGGRLVIHPPANPKHRAWCEGVHFNPLPYLERNRAIVDACDILIATPSNPHEVLRSGTWTTIRYARRCERPMRIFHSGRG